MNEYLNFRLTVLLSTVVLGLCWLIGESIC
jgi:hypothetical protein